MPQSASGSTPSLSPAFLPRISPYGQATRATTSPPPVFGIREFSGEVCFPLRHRHRRGSIVDPGPLPVAHATSQISPSATL